LFCWFTVFTCHLICWVKLAVIGGPSRYANKPGKTDRLRDAGADAVVASMADLHTALLAHRPSSW
jgi:hypothetical protein